MPLPFWEELRAAVIELNPDYELIMDALEQGRVTSADKAYHWLREMYPDITRRWVREAWRDIGEKTGWAGQLAVYPTTKMPPEDWWVEGPPGMMTRLQYVSRIEYYDQYGNLLEVTHVSTRTDKAISYKQIEGLVEDYAERYWVEGATSLKIYPITGVKYRP
jgi:hypothetical protein